MANDEHVALLKQGVAAWNAWRDKNPDIRPDLVAADLSEADLNGADLVAADLSAANLSEADLSAADLSAANLSEADLNGADLRAANLRAANLSAADLSAANLEAAILVDTDLTGADLTGCRIFGISAWRVKLEGARQQNLVVTPEDESRVTVDNIEVAQFIYLFLHNQKIRDVIDTITSKVVLILGRFTAERKVVLDVLREELRKRDYLPVLFAFEHPATRTLDETILTLALISRFIIVDITSSTSAPVELSLVVPQVRIPILPILEEGEAPFAMFRDLRRYPWVLSPVTYKNAEQLAPRLDKLLNGLEAEAQRIGSLKASTRAELSAQSQES